MWDNTKTTRKKIILWRWFSFPKNHSLLLSGRMFSKITLYFKNKISILRKIVFPWISWWALMPYNISPYKSNKEKQIHRQEGDVKTEVEIRVMQLQAQDCGGSHKKLEKTRSSPWREHGLANTLILTILVILIRTSLLWNYKRIHFFTKFVVICYSSHRKWIHRVITQEISKQTEPPEGRNMCLEITIDSKCQEYPHWRDSFAIPSYLRILRVNTAALTPSIYLKILTSGFSVLLIPVLVFQVTWVSVCLFPDLEVKIKIQKQH